MTEKELNQKLIDFSPFKYEGANEKLSFDGEILYIEGSPHDRYKIDDTDTGLQINLSSPFPFQQNVLIDFGEDEQAIIINHQTKNLLQYPNDLRHWAADNGYFILKSLKIDK